MDRRGKKKPEAPFGEFTRYYGPQRWNPYMVVTAVTRRSEAFWDDVMVGHTHWISSPVREGHIFQKVKEVVPTVVNVHVPMSGCGVRHVYIQLRQNVAGLPRSHCMHAALGNSEDDVRLAMPGGYSDNRITGEATEGPTEVVRCTTGAAYLERMGLERVDLLKLDVEGYETEVVRGFAKHLSRVKAIVGEVHERLIDQRAFYSLLEESGYSIVARRETRNAKREGVHIFEAVRHREGILT